MLDHAEIVEANPVDTGSVQDGCHRHPSATRATTTPSATSLGSIEERHEELTVISPNSPLGKALLGAQAPATPSNSTAEAARWPSRSWPSARNPVGAPSHPSSCRRAATSAPRPRDDLVRECRARWRPTLAAAARLDRHRRPQLVPRLRPARPCVSRGRHRPPGARAGHPLRRRFRLADCAHDAAALVAASAPARSSRSATRWAARWPSSSGTATASGGGPRALRHARTRSP